MLSDRWLIGRLTTVFTHTQGVIGRFIPGFHPDLSLEAAVIHLWSLACGSPWVHAPCRNYLNRQPATKLNIPFCLFVCVDIRHKIKNYRSLKKPKTYSCGALNHYIAYLYTTLSLNSGLPSFCHIFLLVSSTPAKNSYIDDHRDIAIDFPYNDLPPGPFFLDSSLYWLTYLCKLYFVLLQLLSAFTHFHYPISITFSFTHFIHPLSGTSSFTNFPYLSPWKDGLSSNSIPLTS